MSVPYLNQIITGDARELAKAIPDESVDLIFTDPPYPREYLYLYDWLGMEAWRILRPGGFLLALCGKTFLDKTMRTLSAGGLTYFWTYEVFQA